MFGQDWRNALAKELVDLLWRSSDKEVGVEQRVQTVMHGREQRILGDAIEEVVRGSFLLDSSARSHGVLSDRLVQHLPISASLDALHEDDLRGHKGQLQGEARPDHRRPHMQPVGDVDERVENHVGGEEALGQHDSADGGVVQSSLKPLRGMGVRTVLDSMMQVWHGRMDAVAIT